MTYTNPVAHMGFRRFAALLAGAGIAGAILPDLPLDELDGWGDAADAAGVETVLLAAPTTPDDRLRAICERAHGFVYGVSLLGVTGERDHVDTQAREMGKRCKAVTDKPVLLGVGISNAEQAVEAAAMPTASSSAVLWSGASSTAVGRKPRTSSSPSSAPRSTHDHVIKYLGSKRRLVPVLGDDLCAAERRRTALDLFTGTTRVAQEFKRRGAHVTAVDTARYAEVFAQCYVATDGDAVDGDELEDALARPRRARRATPGYVTETFCVQSRFFQPLNGGRIDAIRDAIERDYAGRRSNPILLTSLLEAADRVDSTPACRWRT